MRSVIENDNNGRHLEAAQSLPVYFPSNYISNKHNFIVLLEILIRIHQLVIIQSTFFVALPECK